RSERGWPGRGGCRHRCSRGRGRLARAPRLRRCLDDRDRGRHLRGAVALARLRAVADCRRGRTGSVAALILTRGDVAALLDLPDCINAVEEAFRQHALGSAVPPAVLSIHADHGAFHIKAAGVYTPVPYFAAKVNGN